MCFGAFTYPAPFEGGKDPALPVLCLQAEHPRHAAQPHRQRPLLHGDLFGQHRVSRAAGQGLGLQEDTAGFPVRAPLFSSKVRRFRLPPARCQCLSGSADTTCLRTPCCTGRDAWCSLPCRAAPAPGRPRSGTRSRPHEYAAAAQSGCHRPRTPACPNTSTARKWRFFCPFGARRASSRCTRRTAPAARSLHGARADRPAPPVRRFSLSCGRGNPACRSFSAAGRRNIFHCAAAAAPWWMTKAYPVRAAAGCPPRSVRAQ